MTKCVDVTIRERGTRDDNIRSLSLRSLGESLSSVGFARDIVCHLFESPSAVFQKTYTVWKEALLLVSVECGILVWVKNVPLGSS